MKTLLLSLVMALGLATVNARADCRPWTTIEYLPNWSCGYLPDGTYTCWQSAICLNPDGSVAQDGDVWDNLATSYQAIYGAPPDVDEIEQYYMWIC